jgi:hypothetical protein
MVQQRPGFLVQARSGAALCGGLHPRTGQVERLSAVQRLCAARRENRTSKTQLLRSKPQFRWTDGRWLSGVEGYGLGSSTRGLPLLATTTTIAISISRIDHTHRGLLYTNIPWSNRQKCHISVTILSTMRSHEDVTFWRSRQGETPMASSKPPDVVTATG